MQRQGLFTLALLLTTTISTAEIDHSQHETSGMDDHSGHTGAAANIHHQHEKGDWMFEYRYMRMDMAGLQNGTNSIPSKDISGALPGMPPMKDPGKDYMMAPTEMTMDMHMLMVMYGISDRVSVMLMGTYQENSMDMIMHMPMMDMTGSMKTDGLGDALISMMDTVNENWTASLGLSIPVGSIDERVTVTMHGSNPMSGMTTANTNYIKAGYSMQPGSGTWDLIPSLTYAHSTDRFGWGFQANYRWRLGVNDNSYTLGNVLEAIGWGKVVFTPALLGTAKLTVTDLDRIDGQDPELNPARSPMTDPDATGGTRADLGFSLNGFMGEHHVLGVELSIPVHQDLNGPQMETDWILGLSYQLLL
ncbi:MAG: hypothetical protein CL797_03210 [Chromatiales bacterium]|nr:hypothetical protein [Chromatiales bacterium]